MKKKNFGRDGLSYFNCTPTVDKRKRKSFRTFFFYFCFLPFFCVCVAVRKGDGVSFVILLLFFCGVFFVDLASAIKRPVLWAFMSRDICSPSKKKGKKDGCACFRDRLCVFRFCHCCGRALPMNDTGRDKERANYAMGTIIFFNLRNIKEKDKDLRLSKQEKNQTRRRPRAVVIPSLRSS